MKTLDRRRFLATLATWSVGGLALRPLAQASGPRRAFLHVRSGSPGPTVPLNFIGLSYETQQLSDPGFFSPANRGLIDRFRALAPHGVLRLGGNTSDYGFWQPTPASTAPPRARRPYVLGDPPPDLSYAITPQAMHNLRGFLDVTGWTCLYGINLGTNVPALAADEAAYVSRVLGAKLEYFQIGNEADRFGSTIRDPKTWSPEAYLAEWLAFATAIVARVPDARFGMPDIARDETWFAAIGRRLATDPLRAHLACLSHHYYIGGPPANPLMTIDAILTADPRVPQVAAIVSRTAAQLRTRWRMTEGNTCFRGGKPGVSDVFAAALWAADYLLLLASLGYAGVNLHGGDRQMIAMGLGGVLPGDALVHDDPARHPHPYYAPIAHIGADYVAEPVYAGMQLAGVFAGGTMVPVNFDPGPANATAYAAKLPEGRTILAVINKDRRRSVDLAMSGTWESVASLTAPSLESTHASFRAQNGPAPNSVAPASAVILAERK
jgi:hypothetical protein